MLTEREALKQWFPSDVVGEWTVGAKLQFVFQGGEGDGLDEAALQGEVLAVEPMRLLEYRWGENLLRCELIAEAGGCRLIFSESFDDGSIAARNSAGWEWCLANLDLVLADAEPAPFVMHEWRASHVRYVAEFEPLAGPQQGPPEKHPAVVAEKAELER